MERRLGEGGMGEVFLAHDRHHAGRTVALKILRPAVLDGDALEHFRDEFRSLARLRHPNLVEVFDFGQVDETGAPFLTQELVNGPSLAALPAATRREQFESLAAQTLRALDAIHTAGWLHNDLKPQNILITPPLRVRLVDFGLARRLSAAGPAAPSGTLHYLAPERLRAGDPEPRSDLYALGAVLYECLTGRTPFEGKSAGALIGAILEGHPAPPRSLDPSIPERWERFVLRLLARDPDARPRSAEEAIEALNAGARAAQPRDTPETFAGRIRSAPLTARDTEVQALEAAIRSHLDAAPEEAPRLVILSGPAGSGKSRIAEEARQRLQLAVRRTLAGRAHEFGGHALQPFDPTFAAARAAGRLPAAIEPALEQAFGTAAPGRRVAARLERAEMVEALAKGLDALAESQQGVLFLDDLQWASPLAVDLIEHLVARAERSPWLLVASLRDGASPAEARWQALARRARVAAIPLPPMDRPGLVRILTAMLPFGSPPDRLAERLHALGLSQPWHVEEVLKSLFQERLLEHRGGSWSLTPAALRDLPVPESIDDLALARFRALPAGQADAGRLLAIFGKPVALPTFEHALKIAAPRGRPREEARLALEALAGLGLATLTWGDDGVLRAALAQSGMHAALARRLPAAARRALHRAALRAIEATAPERQERIEDLARHAVEAGERKSAATYLLAAARRADALFDARGEANYLRQALDVLPLSERKTRLETASALSEALSGKVGDFQEGARVARALTGEARRAGVTWAEINGLRFESFALGFLGKTAEAERLARKAIALARGANESGELGASLAFLGVLMARTGKPAEAAALLDEAVPLARAEGETKRLLWILNNAALTRFVLGETRASLERFEEVLEVSRRTGANLSYYRAIGNMGIARYDLGDLDGAIASLETAVDWGRAHTELDQAGEGVRSLQQIQTLRGRFDLAAAAGREARRFCELLGQTADDPEALELDGRVELGLGRGAGAVRLFRQGLEEARRRKDPIQEMYLTIALAEACTSAGDRRGAAGGTGGASEDMARGLAAARRLGHARGLFLARRAQGLAALEAEPDSPDRHGTRSVTSVTSLIESIEGAGETDLRFHDRLERGLLLAALDLKRKNPAAAESRLRDIVKTAASAGAREAEWRAHALLARTLEARGQAAPARRARDEAAAVVRRVAAEIEDTDMRDDYLDHPDRKDLLRRATEDGERRAPEAGRATEVDENAQPARPEVRYPMSEETPLPVSRTAERTLATLFEITQTINTIRDPEKLLDRVMDLAIENVRAERGLIFLFGEDGEEMEPVVARNVERQTIKDATAYSRTILREAGRGRAILSHDALQDNRFREYRSVARFHIRSLMCVPLSLRGRTIGTVYVDTRAPGVVFDREDLRFLEAFAAQAAAAVENAQMFEGVRQENESLKQAVRERYGFESLVGRSQGMRDVIETLARVAPSSLPVLIFGESGTGKELVARAIHTNSPRRERSFQTENCAAFSETLLESQLFGHVRGAFTGADTAHRGLFEQADGGTLFLDEVGDMSLAMQSKLLRVLQNGEIRAVGSEQVKRVNVRIVSATNRPLEDLIREKKFREDLYYRLRGVPVSLPPLRDRRDDVPLLVDHFLTKLAKTDGSPRLKAEPALLHLLARMEWRGNVRELENTIYRLALYAENGVITADAARQDQELLGRSASMTGSSSRPAPAPAFEGPRTRPRSVDLSRAEIKRALGEASGSRDEAARILQVSRATLFRKMKDHGLTTREGPPGRPARTSEA